MGKKRSILNLESNLSTEATVADSFSIGIKIVLSFLSLKDNVGSKHSVENLLSLLLKLLVGKVLISEALEPIERRIPS